MYAPRAKSPAALLDGLFQHSPFSLNRHHYSPQTIETSDSNLHPLATIPNGNVEKSRQRRSRPFAVLTYYEYAPRVKRAAALLDGFF